MLKMVRCDQLIISLKFVEFVNPIYQKNENGFQVNVGVKYLSSIENVTTTYQYQLKLIKGRKLENYCFMMNILKKTVIELSSKICKIINQ